MEYFKYNFCKGSTSILYSPKRTFYLRHLFSALRFLIEMRRKTQLQHWTVLTISPSPKSSLYKFGNQCLGVLTTLHKVSLQSLIHGAYHWKLSLGAPVTNSRLPAFTIPLALSPALNLKRQCKRIFYFKLPHFSKFVPRLLSFFF